MQTEQNVIEAEFLNFSSGSENSKLTGSQQNSVELIAAASSDRSSKNVEELNCGKAQNSQIQMARKRINKRKMTGKKYPGVTFLKSSRNSRGGRKFKNFSPSRADEKQRKDRKRMKRKLRRQNRREVERKFRKDLETAFNLEKIEVGKPEHLPTKIDQNTFKGKGKLSDFPIEFCDWVMKSKGDRKIENFRPGEVGFEKVADLIHSSHSVNRKGACTVADLIDSLKEIDFINNSSSN
jgi:hypothetical protein